MFKERVHAREPSVLRSAAGSPQNGSLWGDSLEAFCVCVYAVCVLACVCVCDALLSVKEREKKNVSAVFSPLAIRCFYDYVM